MSAAADELTIRGLTPDDGELFREIRLESLRLSADAYGSAFEVESAHPLDWFNDRLDRSQVFGALRNAALVGIAGLVIDDGPKRKHKGHLWGVYVRSAERGRGTARRLCEAVIRAVHGQVEILQLTVTASNASARRLYLALGFVEFGIEVKARKVDGQYYDDVHMAKELSP
jgi:ribosomal protein S18 acetylase RimI-like enzyme